MKSGLEHLKLTAKQGGQGELLAPITLGLIVNPVAGIGGPAALKGSDDRDLVAKVLKGGAEGRSSQRVKRFLERLALSVGARVKIIACPDPMGAREAIASGIETSLLATGRRSAAVTSSAEDSVAAATAMLDGGIDLLVFAGGDGTARDICSAIGDRLPVLGIPAGVKMHSGVFALSPEAAAEVVMAVMKADLVDLRLQQVRDIDEAALREGVVNSRFFGEMRVPEFGQFVQATKSGGREDESLVQDDIGAQIREQMDENTLYLVGAGTTTQALMRELGMEGTLLGVDAVCNEKVVGTDLCANGLESLLSAHKGPIVIILSVTGGQGALSGRGNQQFTPSVLRRVGRDNLWVLATKTKIQQLQGRPLIMDSNDPQLDLAWQGYIPVITGYRDQILYPLGLHSDALVSAQAAAQMAAEVER